ncbi:PT domain-containing protein [Nocardioides lijunqiniae]|uniref:PT domain-containing protein n=1 Tax=Nocardioides lijunqiniae TaxID=2760832 RepID=UPI0018781545|nr:PT domain-containing protein [Nocardioides lijunqiniae]
MELHETLHELGVASGRGVFDDADLLRAALDDYLDEGAASTGDINLLVDAVRLGALRMMLATIDSGAEPARAVEAAGEMLARDRGTSDVAATRWACAVLGFAVDRVGADDVRRFDRHAPQQGPASGPAPSSRPPGYPAPAPVWSGQPPATSPVQPPPTSPPWQQPYAAAPGYPASYPAGPPPKKSRTGLLVAIGAVALAVVGGVLTVVLLTSGDDDKGDETATDPTSEATTEPTDEPTDEPTAEPTEEPTEVPAGAVEGTGYYFALPEGWTDITAEVLKTEGAAQTDLAVAWGKSFDGARANMIVETAFAGGETDPEVLRSTWQNNMAGATGATPEDNGTTVIDGEDAIGVRIARVNENDVAIEQFGYLTIHDGDLYSIILSTQAGDQKSQDFYEQILADWTWAS